MLLFSSPQMLKNFEDFGQFVAFDLTYNLVNENKLGKNNWAVGVFLGKNNHNRPIPFCVVLINDESK